LLQDPRPLPPRVRLMMLASAAALLLAPTGLLLLAGK
jgi:hypothetical protein